MSVPEYRMRPREGLASGLAYLAVLIPLWGIPIAWFIRESWRERSRHVVFHTTQAIWLHVAILVAFIIYAANTLIFVVLRQIHQTVSDALSLANTVIFLTLACLYVMVTLIAAWRALDGRSFVAPSIGRRIWREEYETDHANATNSSAR